MVTWSIPAKNDLKQIYDYIAIDNDLPLNNNKQPISVKISSILYPVSRIHYLESCIMYLVSSSRTNKIHPVKFLPR